MAQSFIFALAIFIGWLIFDFVKQKRLTKENVFGALFVAVIAGVAWYVLDLFLP